jgi:hypothetical protein
VAYDDDNVYLAVEATDEKHVTDPKQMPWRQDGVELFLSAVPDPQRSQLRGWGHLWNEELQLAIAGPSTDDLVVWERARHPKGTRIARRRTASGHATEVAIPVAYFDEKQGQPWEAFRLNVAVNDSDVPGERVQIWWRPDWRRSEKTYAGSGTFVKG